MTKTCHLFDESAGWEQCLGAAQLIEHGAGERPLAIAIDPRGATTAHTAGAQVQPFRRLAGFTPTAAPPVYRFLRRHGIDFLHAWGLEAALAGRAASDSPLVLHLFEPKLPPRRLKLIRTLARSGGFAVACATETVRRRLIESGVPADVSVVVRPAVDFGLIQQCQKSDLRLRLGLAHDTFVVLIPEPVGVQDTAIQVYWAVELSHAMSEEIRLLVPGTSRGGRRIERLDERILDTRVVVRPDPAISFERLVAISDALVVIPDGSASTTAIAWAMASGTAVIAAAEYATAELIANKVNGLLFNPKSDDSIATTVARLLADRESQAKAREVARGHAYEVFGLRRYLDQQDRLRSNLLTGHPPSTGITDSARVG